jgi:hypothetical protein
MSQHSDIIKFEISAGIADGLSTGRIVERIQGVLETLEWDSDTIENALVDAHNTAKWMRTQKDFLYGVSHDQLDHFINESGRYLKMA